MRILFIVPYTPTPIRTRPYNLLRELARRGHALTLATLWQNEEERVALQEWERAGVRVIAAPLPRLRPLWNSLGALPTSAPLQAVYCWQPALRRLLDAQFAISNRQFDLIHVEHLRGARYGLHLKAVLGPRSSVPLVWDSVDCISHLFAQASQTSASASSRLVTRLELGRTRRYEAWLAGQFDQVLVTSPVDKEAFQRLNVGTLKRSNVAPITVIPNGVDLDYFQPGAWPRLPDTIVFSGKMSYHANVTAALYFAQQVLPRVWASRPAARFTIVGYNPPSEVRVLAKDPRITVTGSVPDIRPYLQQASLSVAPMPYGAGIQNKVLEAMACATPVVATRQAISAVQATPGEHLLVGSDAQDLAGQIVRLLGDTEQQKKIGQAGRRYVEEHHDWHIIAASLEMVYGAMIARSDGEAHG